MLGNIWVFVLGGFHTSANTLHFILVLLAMYPAIQRTLQESIDKLTQDCDPSAWSHSTDFPRFLNSHVGAVVAETLRCFGVLPWIPKTNGDAATTIMVDSPEAGTMEAVIPPNTLLLVNTSAVHRNPNNWPASEATYSGETEPFAASGWNPWRWLKNAPTPTGEELGIESTEFDSLLTSGWEPGSYIPFSDGARACIGKRFAQTELCAVLARLMKDCSVELKTEGSGLEAWTRARDEAARKLNSDVGITLALELKTDIPLMFEARY
jgi:cytochrome P450